MRILYSVLFLSSVLTGCQGDTVITGTASYGENMTLPHGAIFEAVLEDISIMDVAAEQLGKTQIDKINQHPINFTIPYDNAQVQDRHSYAVRGRITINGKLLFTTDTVHSVLTRGCDATVQLKLRPINQKGDR